MEKVKNIQTKGRKRDIYFEYLELKNLDTKYHLISVDSDNYNLIIPNNYKIDYSRSNNEYDTRGHIYFYNSKYTYTLDYTRKTYDDYKIHMEKRKSNIVKTFKNFMGREFIELCKNNVDNIYMYYSDYYFKIYSDHKLSMNEYYDMYLILFSISRKKINNSLELLKELYFFGGNAIKYICNDKDLLNSNLKEYTDDIKLNISDILVYNDDKYLKYKDTKKKAESISSQILSDVGDTLTIDLINDRWCIVGNFKFGRLFNFNVGYIDMYNEIIDSEELSIDEKKDILTKVILEKQYELEGYKGSIKKDFYTYLRDYINRELSYELWNTYHFREFINFDIIDSYDEELNDFGLYKLFMSNIFSDIHLFNDKLVMDSIKTDEIIIYPNEYVLKITGLNGLFNGIKIKFNEEFNLIFK